MRYIYLKISPVHSIELWKDLLMRLIVKRVQGFIHVQFPYVDHDLGYWYIIWKVKSCVHYFLSNFYSFTNVSPSKTTKKCFLFHQKSSFHTQDIQMLVFFCFLETKGWRKLCMVPFHNCYIYGTWRSKEMRREVL